MQMQKFLLVGLALAAAAPACADHRLFTYTYEPETAPQGLFEFEYGLTDNYTVSLYVNHQYETYKDPVTGARASK